MSLRAERGRVLSWFFPALLLGALMLHVGTQEQLVSTGEPDDAARQRIANAVRAAEPRFRREALEQFPGDEWSQDDHFAARERGLVRKLAEQEQVRIGAVFEVMDRDIKRGGPGARERARVAPCMPRPFYE